MSLLKLFFLTCLISVGSRIVASEQKPQITKGQIAQDMFSPIERQYQQEQAFLALVNGKLSKEGIQLASIPVNQRTSHKRNRAISPRPGKSVVAATGVGDLFLRDRLQVSAGSVCAARTAIAPQEKLIDPASQDYLEAMVEAVEKRINQLA